MTIFYDFRNGEIRAIENALLSLSLKFIASLWRRDAESLMEKVSALCIRRTHKLQPKLCKILLNFDYYASYLLLFRGRKELYNKPLGIHTLGGVCVCVYRRSSCSLEQ